MRHLPLMLALVLAPSLSGTLAAQNSNEDAPTATHAIEFAGGESLEVSYRQLTLAGGSSLKQLLSKGLQGDQVRTFYNDQYLPNFLQGKLDLKQAMTLGGQAIAAGSYAFTFRIDNSLQWHLVVSNDDGEVCSLELAASKRKRKMAKRLVVEPVASSNEEPSGHLRIRYGPLYTEVAFGPAKSADGEDGAKKPAEASAEKNAKKKQ